MKKILILILTFLMVFGAFAAVTNAIDSGEQRVMIGADLDDSQVDQIYRDFGITRGSVTEIIVTNANERAYLEGLVPDKKIGSVALSCAYITTLDPGAGLQISTNNINYCTSDMYVNALTTAGITDAKVMISAPFPVSGTAALTGIYRAYEDISGSTLSELAKAVGAEELVVTGDLAQYIGSEEATKLINELKLILDQTSNMTESELRAEIDSLASTYNVALTDGQKTQVYGLVRSLEKLDTDALKDKLLTITKGIETANKAQTVVTQVVDSVKNFFVSVGDFFVNLFGGKS